MAYTEASLTVIIETLEESLGHPEASISLPDGSSVSYKSDKDKLAAIAYFKSLLSSLSTSTPRVRQVRLYSRGN